MPSSASTLSSHLPSALPNSLPSSSLLPSSLCPPPSAHLPLPSSLCPPPSALLPLPSSLCPPPRGPLPSSTPQAKRRRCDRQGNSSFAASISHSSAAAAAATPRPTKPRNHCHWQFPLKSLKSLKSKDNSQHGCQVNPYLSHHGRWRVWRDLCDFIGAPHV